MDKIFRVEFEMYHCSLSRTEYLRAPLDLGVFEPLCPLLKVVLFEKSVSSILMHNFPSFYI